MTTLSKEDVVRWEAEADKFKTGEFTDTLDIKSFATLVRADLVAENERLKGELETGRRRLAAAGKGAERYRWRVSDEGGDVLYETLTGVYAEKKDVDAAIDLKARQASAFRPGKDSASAGADSMSS